MDEISSSQECLLLEEMDKTIADSTFSPRFCSMATSEVLVNNLVASMVESQPGTVEVAFPNSGAAAMPGREQG